MGCQQFGNAIVCAPTGFTYRAVQNCPTCKHRTRHLVSMYVWYGDDVTCLSCGNSWSEGYLRSRGKKDRTHAQARAKAQWPLAATRQQAWAALQAEIDIYTAPVDEPAQVTG